MNRPLLRSQVASNWFFPCQSSLFSFLRGRIWDQFDHCRVLPAHARVRVQPCVRPLHAIRTFCFMCMRTVADDSAVILLHRERRSLSDRLTAGVAFSSHHSRSAGGWTWNKPGRTATSDPFQVTGDSLKLIAPTWPHQLSCSESKWHLLFENLNISQFVFERIEIF